VSAGVAACSAPAPLPPKIAAMAHDSLGLKFISHPLYSNLFKPLAPKSPARAYVR
jgi:hypothetical protein